MRRRQKFCDLAVYVPSEAMDVLARGARLRGTAWHVAYAEIERRLKVEAEAAAVRIIEEYAADESANQRMGE